MNYLENNDLSSREMTFLFFLIFQLVNSSTLEFLGFKYTMHIVKRNLSKCLKITSRKKRNIVTDLNPKYFSFFFLSFRIPRVLKN